MELRFLSEYDMQIKLITRICFPGAEHSRRPLTWEKRMRIATGAAKGLQYLHEKNIVHRDMRPNNILVTHDFESLVNPTGILRIFICSLEYFFNKS